MAAVNSIAPILTPEQVTRFWSHVDRRGPDECWLWTGVPHRSGYANFRAGPMPKIRAHVLARFLATSEWPGTLETCHSCDVHYLPGDTTYRRCCNPAHLWLGTHAENMADMVRKGRNKPNQVRGERQGQARLTTAAVAEIRRLYATGHTTLTALGEQFGVCIATIHCVVKRVYWKHIP